MNLTELLDLRGRLKIEKVFPDGRRELVFDKDNLIVKSAKLFMLSQIYGSGIMSDPITTLKIGDEGNIDPEGLYPKAESPTQEDLYNPVLSVDVTYTLDLDNISVTFLADVDQTQCNGVQLTEAGLFKDSGDMFNVKNHPGINKTSDFSVHYSWTIRFI